MRSIKILGLVAMTALAAMAFIGATTAAADTGCTTEVSDSGECPAANRLALPFTVSATSPAAVLKAEGVEATTCESTTKGEAKTNAGSHKALIGLINTLTFTNCHGGCSAVEGNSGKHLPYKVEALALTLLWHITSDGNGNPGALLTGCFGFFNCEYTTASALLTFDPPSGTTPARLLANGIPLTRSGDSAFCPATATWTATYTATAPNGGFVWLTALP